MPLDTSTRKSRPMPAAWILRLSGIVVLSATVGCYEPPAPLDLSKGTVLEESIDAEATDRLLERVDSVTSPALDSSGLVGARGGARVKLHASGTHRVLVPMPQMTPTQIPIAYAIRCTPDEAVEEIRLHRREDLNDVVGLELEGNSGDEVQIDWAATVLLLPGEKPCSPADQTAYQVATACVQSEDPQIKELAESLWPESGDITDYARVIQTSVSNMEQAQRPMSLDAKGILASGANGICTANANLALALLRTRGVPCRSLAVIPPTSQRLEMHRVVQYASDGKWHTFDPSSVHRDIPMKPSQSVIMSHTSIFDESISMTPRMSTMRGCPYGQEMELLTPKVTLWGSDFFWTIAKPIMAISPSDEVISESRRRWQSFLKTGRLDSKSIHASFVSDESELAASLEP